MTERHYKIFQAECGRWWVWCEADQCNLAYRQPTREAAIAQALDMAIFSMTLHRDARREAESKLARVQDCFTEVFNPDGE